MCLYIIQFHSHLSTSVDKCHTSVYTCGQGKVFLPNYVSVVCSLKMRSINLVYGGKLINYHSDKDVNKAIVYAVGKGWRFVKKGNGHTVAYLYCTSDSDGKHEEADCHIAIFGSPKNPTNHAKKIRKAVDGHSC